MTGRGLTRHIALALYYGIAQHLPSRGPGARWCRAVRYALCRRFLAQCGERVVIEHDVYLNGGQDVRIGDRSGLGTSCRVYGALVIGNDVMVGPEVVFLSANHRFDRRDVTIGEQGSTDRDPPRLEDDVWVGLRATILPGRIIGRGSVVAACAVVTRDVEPYTVVAGNPARVVGQRGRPAPHR